MRILFLSQILPYPLDSGVKIRSYFTLRTLAEEHDVTLACFVRDDNTPAQIEHLGAYCREVHTVLMRRSRLKDAGFLAQSVLTNRPFIIVRDRVRAMEQLVDRLVMEAASAGRPYDAVHSDQLWMAQYALRVHGVKRVLDQHNAVYLIPKRLAQNEGNPARRLMLEREWRRLVAYEVGTCRRFDRLITVTEEDRLALQQIANGDLPPTTVLPICVDPAATGPVQRDPNSDTLLHLGTMYWPPNVEGVLWFAREVLPRVRAQVPEARFCVVGKNPPRSIQGLAADPAVMVAGYVADPVPYLCDCAAFLVPLSSGGGMRVKILDAWMWGVPVVSTTIGAEGIEVLPDENILMADGAAAFAGAVVRLLQDRELGCRLAQNGRSWVEERYNWRTRYQALGDLYRRL